MTLFCGPMRMLDAARRAWEAAGRPMTDLRYETFGSSGLLPTEAFRVRRRGPGDRAVTEFVIPRDRSMLDVLDEAGHEVMSDCRRGECGVCALDVVDVDGEIDHRDVFFSAHQKQESRKDLRLRLPRPRHHHGGYPASRRRVLTRPAGKA